MGSSLVWVCRAVPFQSRLRGTVDGISPIDVHELFEWQTACAPEMKKVTLPPYPLRALHLVAIWAYAVSQPVFSLLDANPEFLVVRGSSRLEVVVFAVLLVLGPPLVALASELVVGTASSRTADLLHLVYLGVFVAPLALQLMKAFDASRVVAVLSTAAVAVLAVNVYARFRAARLFLAFSLTLPVVGFFSFVWAVPLATTDEVSRVNLKISARTPVVVLVLDELPTSSLLASDGSIDEKRYPSFARLARDGTWYPAATTVHEYTTHAVPAILDGRLPEPDALPTLGDHPGNLFTLLGESYDLRVVQNSTRLCPRRFCPSVGGGSVARRLQSLFSDVRVAYLHRILPTSLAYGLPTVDGRWGGFADEVPETRASDPILGARDVHEVNRSLSNSTGRPRGDFELFLSSIQRGEPARTLHFMHALLPHSPWRFFPSGREYGNDAAIDGSLRNSWNDWANDPWFVQQVYQRHLLQVGYTDRLLGRVLERLETTGLYERALVVVTADHGMSFVVGGKRRTVNRENIADIARVPLLIKFPGQRKGRVDPRAVRTIDLFPTIAAVLGVRLPWAIDGHSLLATELEPARVVVMQQNGTRVDASPEEVERRMDVTVRRKLALFGEGEDSLYRIGTNPRLLGLSVAGMRTQQSSAIRVHFDGEGLLDDVVMSSSFVPARITGFIEGTEIPNGAELAVAVNGRIAALTRCFSDDGGRRFTALAPETMFRNGFNRVELLLIEGVPSAPRLIKLGESSAA